MRRRTFLQRGTALAAGLGVHAGLRAQALLTRPVPSSGERLPLVGLGSWITFNVGRDPEGRERSTEVMKRFFEAGGRLIDSSPMYGSSQAVIGEALERIGAARRVFSADKVWTASDGAEQVQASRRLWRIDRFDLLQVHNLLAWQKQLPMLLEMKAQARLRYVGITTSEGRRHREFEQIMRTQPLDFVQLTYNPADREVEQRLLPLARDRGIAVLANRPFRQGELLEALQGQPLPGWAAEIGCRTWAQVVLKFIVSHPAVTCAIPATSNPAHAAENMAAAHGQLPDEALRQRIAAHIARL